MIIGKLDRRCRIERKLVTIDPTYGTENVTWVTHAVVWCNMQDVLPSRDESLRNGIIVGKTQSRLRMRYRGDIDSTMRIVIMRPTESVWNIIGGPAEIGVRDGIELMCEKVTT